MPLWLMIDDTLDAEVAEGGFTWSLTIPSNLFDYRYNLYPTCYISADIVALYISALLSET